LAAALAVTAKRGALIAEAKMALVKKKKKRLGKHYRRKHHWRVTIYYGDGEKFARVYMDRDQARRFAARQKKSPVVKRTRVIAVA
jgi:hypothetical protein